MSNNTVRLTFKIDTSKKLPEGCVRKTVTVDGMTFTLIGKHLHWDKRSREYMLTGPDVALHVTKGRSWRAGSFGLDGISITGGCTDANLIRDEVSLGRGMAMHTAETKAKAIIRKVLAS